jgi:hypothetical protein
MAASNTVFASLLNDYNKMFDSPDTKQAINPSYAKEFQQSTDSAFNAYMSAYNFFHNISVRNEIDKQTQIDQVGNMEDKVQNAIDLLSPEKDKEQYDTLVAFRDRVRDLSTHLIRNRYNMYNNNAIRALAASFKGEVSPILASVAEYRTLLNDSIIKSNENKNLFVDKNYIGMSMSEFMKHRQNGDEVYNAFDATDSYKQAKEYGAQISKRHFMTSHEIDKATELVDIVKRFGYTSEVQDYLEQIDGAKEQLDRIFEASKMNDGNYDAVQQEQFKRNLLVNFINGVTLQEDIQTKNNEAEILKLQRDKLKNELDIAKARQAGKNGGSGSGSGGNASLYKAQLDAWMKVNTREEKYTFSRNAGSYYSSKYDIDRDGDLSVSNKSGVVAPNAQSSSGYSASSIPESNHAYNGRIISYDLVNVLIDTIKDKTKELKDAISEVRVNDKGSYQTNIESAIIKKLVDKDQNTGGTPVMSKENASILFGLLAAMNNAFGVQGKRATGNESEDEKKAFVNGVKAFDFSIQGVLNGDVDASTIVNLLDRYGATIHQGTNGGVYVEFTRDVNEPITRTILLNNMTYEDLSNAVNKGIFKFNPIATTNASGIFANSGVSNGNAATQSDNYYEE